MNGNLTCNQVISVLNLYVENKLSKTISEYVKKHLKNCASCQKKYNELKSIIEQYTVPSSNEDSEKLSDDMLISLSAYVDNELNNNENIKIKKVTISNPIVRKKLESMYSFKKLMQSAYNKTKGEYKIDNAKYIVAQVIDNTDYSTTYFLRIIILFTFIVTAILCCLIYLYL